MTSVKTHTGTVITKDGPQVKNCSRQSGCGSSAKTNFTTKRSGASATNDRLLVGA